MSRLETIRLRLDWAYKPRGRYFNRSGVTLGGPPSREDVKKFIVIACKLLATGPWPGEE